MPCDSIVLKGSAFVNEVGFTGENIPVGKFALEKADNAFEPEHWLYEGSPLVTCKEGTMAVAVNTAFSTRKGKIIRKILHGNETVSKPVVNGSCSASGHPLLRSFALSTASCRPRPPCSTKNAKPSSISALGLAI